MKIINILLLLLLSLNASNIEFTDKEKAYISSHPYVKASNELDWYPYDFNEYGEEKGYSVDYLKYLANKVDIHIHFVSANWAELQTKFKNKEIDILYPVRKTEERKNKYRFSDKFITTKSSLVTRVKNQDVKSLDDMDGKTLAVVTGWASTEHIKKKYKNIKYKYYDTSVEALEAVAFSIADAGVNDFLSSNYIINKERFSNLHVVSKIEFKELESKDLFLMFQKDNEILHGLFNKALRDTSTDELIEIRQKWIIDTSELKDNLTLSLNEKNYLKNKKTIKMCIDPHWMPFEMNDNGVHVGMSKDYMELIEKQINIPIEMVNTKSWLESVEFAKSRKCDIISLAMPTPTRKVFMNFTKPYLKIPLVLATRLDELFYSDISAITDRTMGVVKGYAYAEILKVKHPNMKLVDVASVDDGLSKVEKGEIFGFIGTLATVGYKIQKEYVGNLKIAGKFDEIWELGVATRSDEPELLSIFEKLIASIDKNKHQEILNNWLSVRYQKNTDYSLFWQILVGIVILIAFMLYRQIQLNEYNKKLEILSITDKLTGIYNRLKLDQVLIYAKSIFDRYKRSLSIIIFDIDDFKKVNDSHGHQVGDKVLKKLTQIVMENKRNTDIFGRWGGEEFLIICYETDINGALEVAEKLKEAINSYHFDEAMKQSASFGVAQFYDNESIEKVLDRADKGLYKAKESGKNKVCYI